jgi:imidazolonepropionase-like amidohydrolase
VTAIDTAPHARASFVLRGVAALDESGGFSDPLDVAVVNGRIVAVGRGLAAPKEGAEIDFSGLWIMPGVFDCHDHVTWSSTNEVEALRTPITQWALEGTCNLRATLNAGVTYVRDAAGADAGIREAVARGYVDGPRLQISLNLLGPTGGHGDGYFEGAGIDWKPMPEWIGRPPSLVDGVDEMRRTVRQLLRAGVDWIKLCATGGTVSPHDSPDQPQLTYEEICTAVTEASRRGKPVMAHAYGGQGLSDAVRAGVRSIEHGVFLTEAQAKEMATAGCWLVPTLSILRDVVRWAEDAATKDVSGAADRLPAYAIDKALDLKPLIGEAVRLAKHAGVPIAIGTDFINRSQHGHNLGELPLMLEAGLTTEEVLLAATRGGAQLCGVDSAYGRLAPGYVFDAIVLDADPGDLSCFSSPGAVTGVFQGGRPVVPHERLDA